MVVAGGAGRGGGVQRWAEVSPPPPRPSPARASKGELSERLRLRFPPPRGPRSAASRESAAGGSASGAVWGRSASRNGGAAALLTASPTQKRSAASLVAGVGGCGAIRVGALSSGGTLSGFAAGCMATTTLNGESLLLDATHVCACVCVHLPMRARAVEGGREEGEGKEGQLQEAVEDTPHSHKREAEALFLPSPLLSGACDRVRAWYHTDRGSGGGGGGRESEKRRKETLRVECSCWGWMVEWTALARQRGVAAKYGEGEGGMGVCLPLTSPFPQRPRRHAMIGEASADHEIRPKDTVCIAICTSCVCVLR